VLLISLLDFEVERVGGLMPKNIVVCCDGTSNQYTWDKTNVLKLYYALVNDPIHQIVYYHPGIGTMGPAGAITKFDKWWTTELGLAMGFGIENDIRDAYVFLMNNFEPGDNLFLFGFSRGAYTARSLASVLRMYGLIRGGEDPLVPYAIRMMNEMNKNSNKSNPTAVLQLADGFKETFSAICKPRFVGVWDTVSSVGWVGNPLKLPFTANNPDIAVGRHAVAIDERRAFFAPNLWRWKPDVEDHGPKDLLQVWFPGSHSDVGGGYPENQSQQSKYALQWLMVEARDKGLLFDDKRARWVLGVTDGSPYKRASVELPVHESLVGWWKLAEYVPRPHYDWQSGKTAREMHRGRRRRMPDQSLVHESAFLRGPEYMQGIGANPVKVSIREF